MEIIIGAVVFGLIVIAIIVMVIINFTYRSIKKRREDMEDDYYQHLKEKEQKEKHPFGKDYFKRAEGQTCLSVVRAEAEAAGAAQATGTASKADR